MTLDEEIQAALGWDLNHPEAFCDTCGTRNVVWFTNSHYWNQATAVMPNGRGHILCPQCFVAAFETATGLPSVWELVPTVQTLSRLVSDECAAASAETATERDQP